MQRQKLRDGAAAQRETDDVCTLDFQRIKDANHVQRLLPAVGGRITRRITFAVAAGIKCNDAEVLGQVVDHALRGPAFEVRSTAVQKYDGLALAGIDVADFDTVGIKVLVFKGQCRCSGKTQQQCGVKNE